MGDVEVSNPAMEKYFGKWEQFVSDLMSSDDISDAALYDLGGTLLASSKPEFELTLEEFQELKEKVCKPDLAYKNGVTVNGTTYCTHLADGHFGIMAKNGFLQPGCSVCKTEKLLIVGVHTGEMKPTECNEVIMALGDFFREKGL